MHWKPASFVKTEEHPYRPVHHNTTGIPDHMVMVSTKDVPVVTMQYGYTDIEERTKAEVVAIIACMNEQGKFVSKAWVCEKLNFKDRKADDLFTALKKEGRIAEYLACRKGCNNGHFWRVAGKEMKRKMQRAHAKLRRDLRASQMESFNSPYDGSLEPKDNSPNLSPFRAEAVNNGFGTVQKISLRHMAHSRNHEDGAPGDGLNGTQYTQQGCFDRLTNPDNKVEYALMETLIEASHDQFLSPAAARSAARRIDSGVITSESVSCLTAAIKEKKLCYSLLELIRNFEELAKEHCTFVRKEELDIIKEQIHDIVEGTAKRHVHEEIRISNKMLQHISKLPPGDSGLSFDCLSGLLESDHLAIYAKLFILSVYDNVSDDMLKRLTAKFKHRLYSELSADLTAYNFLSSCPNFNFINWNEFKQFRKKYVANLRCTLFINKLSHKDLDSFYMQLNFMEKLYDDRIEQHSGVVAEHYTSGDSDSGRSVESLAWAGGNP